MRYLISLIYVLMFSTKIFIKNLIYKEDIQILGRTQIQNIKDFNVKRIYDI